MLRRFFITPYVAEPILSTLLTSFLIFGLFIVYSTTSILSYERFGSDTFFVSRHLIHMTIGALLTLVFARIKFDWLKHHAYLIFGLTIGFLIMTLIPGIGSHVGGADRWVIVGGMSIQPSEFCKIGFLLYLAHSLSKKMEKGTVDQFSIGILPHIVMTGLISGILLMQPDFGNAVVFIVLCGFLMFIAGVNLIHLILLMISAVPAAIYMIVHSPYRMKRWLTFLNPWEDPMKHGFQVIQSLMSFSSGGLMGKGIGNSQGKLFFVPESHSDFVFAIMGEELGFLGIVVFISLWLCFVFRGFKIARQCGDPFSYLVASGAIFLLMLQSLIHMMVNLSLLPAKGMNLPFMSTGGSNLILAMILTGLLLNCAIKNKTETP